MPGRAFLPLGPKLLGETKGGTASVPALAMWRKKTRRCSRRRRARVEARLGYAPDVHAKLLLVRLLVLLSRHVA